MMFVLTPFNVQPTGRLVAGRLGSEAAINSRLLGLVETGRFQTWEVALLLSSTQAGLLVGASKATLTTVKTATELVTEE